VPNTHALPDLPLTELAVTLLTPMFLIAARGDVGLAGQAARGMLEEYGATTQAAMLSVVQIIAFAMASLNTLTLSMAEDAPLNVALRACNCADRLSKAELRHRRLHEKQQQEAAQAPPASTEAAEAASAASADEQPRQTDEPRPPLPPQAEAVLLGRPLPSGPDAPPPVPPEVQAEWRQRFAKSAARVADGFEAALDGLPPEEQAGQRFRIEALRRASKLMLDNQPLPEYPDMLFGPDEMMLETTSG